VNARPSAAERLGKPEGVLTRSDLRDLGWERRGIDAIFGNVPVIALPDYARPVIRCEDYLDYLAKFTYDDKRVRP
jgi:hypothetical protein